MGRFRLTHYGPLCGAAYLACLGLVVLANESDDRTEGRVMPADGPGRHREYVGIKRCRMCHTAQYESWLERAKGHSWEALMPGVSREIKLAAHLDADRDYTRDAECLPCHTIGYGEPGGYEIPAPGDGRAERLAETRQGVGCESCHGPGSEFVRIMQDVRRNERTYRIEELRAAGRREVGPQVCLKCHNEEAVCIPAASEGLERISQIRRGHMDRSGFHEEYPLQFRQAAATAGIPSPGDQRSN